MGDGPVAVPGELAPEAVHAVAARIGAYRWAEQRLFELTGRWSVAPGVSAGARVHLFEASAEHAWHAELWAERLPVLTGVDPDELTRPAGPVLGPLFGALGGPGEGDGSGVGSGERGGEVRWLAGLYRVGLPRLLVSYREHLSRLEPAAGRPIARALSLVLADEVEEQLSGEALLQGLLRLPGHAAAAAEAQRDLESLAVGAIGGAGLVPWP